VKIYFPAISAIKNARYIFVLLLLFTLHSALFNEAFAHSYGERDLIYRVIGGKTDRKYRFDILDVYDEYLPATKDATGKQQQRSLTFRYKVEIACVLHCGSNPQTFSCYPDFGPISAFQLKKNDDIFLSLWGSGSAYRVFIFQANEAGIKAFPEIGTKTVPMLLIDRNGEPVVVITNPDEDDRKYKKLSVNGIVFRYSGDNYDVR
jgi:hypothetical protein